MKMPEIVTDIMELDEWRKLDGVRRLRVLVYVLWRTYQFKAKWALKRWRLMLIASQWQVYGRIHTRQKTVEALEKAGAKLIRQDRQGQYYRLHVQNTGTIGMTVPYQNLKY